MRNRNHGRPDEPAVAEVIELFAGKRARLSKKFGAVHPVLMTQQGEPAPATVTPIESRRRRGSETG